MIPKWLPELPTGYAWKLKDDGGTTYPYCWSIDKVNSHRSVSGDWRSNPFGLWARVEVHFAAKRLWAEVDRTSVKAKRRDRASMVRDALQAKAREQREIEVLLRAELTTGKERY